MAARTWFGFCTILVVSSCGLAHLPRAQDRLNINTPSVWQAAGNQNNQKISQGWLQEFSDARLRETVRQAQEHNQDLQATAARLRAAKELTIQSRASLLPRLNAGGSGGFSDSDSGSSERYGLTIASSWEPDLWGRLRDLNRAVAADFDAAVAELRNARLSLAAATAKSYCNLISAQQQLVLAETTRDSFEKNLRIIERNYKAGVPNVRALDVQLGRSNVSAAQRSAKARELERDNSTRALEVLLGKYPSTTFQSGRDLPTLSRAIPLGMPAQLVERRPDLQASRARIVATALRASASRKNLLPNLSLLGSATLNQATVSRLLNPSDLATSISANLTQALYAGGALESEVREAVARNQAAIHDYAQLALEAFLEVESAIAAESSLAAQENDLQKEVEQAALAERQAERDYSEGIDGVDILSVLESQRRANNARSALIRLKNERLQNRIDLHLALGGSF
jgi:NodT family efflux transporter outer membrane factor (OMF) lipoprotein